jgi:hypothetical protein
VQLAVKLHELYFRTQEDWACLPEWVKFYLSLGSYISSGPMDGRRLIAGVALPTRAFAAVFAAAGVVCEWNNRNGGDTNGIDHFEELCGLPVSTAVTYLAGERNKLGVILGCFKVGGERWLRIQTGHPHNNAETHGVNNRTAYRVQVVPELGIMDPRDLPYNQYGTLITPPSEFARRVLGEEMAYNFTLQPHMKALLVGRVNHLRREAIDTNFAVIKEGKTDQVPSFCAGTIQELIRSRRLFGMTNKPYRTDIFPSNSRRAPRTLQEPPPLIIFDGSHGFLRWRNHWRGSNWLVLLDVTEGNFGDAREALNSEYRTMREDDDVPLDLPTPPEGVELVFYREKVHG